MVCCIASGLARRSAPIAGNAGKIVSIENGPNIASAASSGASVRRRGVGAASIGTIQGDPACYTTASQQRSTAAMRLAVLQNERAATRRAWIMRTSRSRTRIEELLALAGVHVDGPEPHDIQVHDDRLYGRILAHGSLGLGEAHMDGWWDADA